MIITLFELKSYMTFSVDTTTSLWVVVTSIDKSTRLQTSFMSKMRSSTLQHKIRRETSQPLATHFPEFSQIERTYVLKLVKTKVEVVNGETKTRWFTEVKVSED